MNSGRIPRVALHGGQQANIMEDIPYIKIHCGLAAGGLQ